MFEYMRTEQNTVRFFFMPKIVQKKSKVFLEIIKDVIKLKNSVDRLRCRMDKIFQNSTARINKIENMKRDTEEINKNMYVIRVLKRETAKTGRGKNPQRKD